MLVCYPTRRIPQPTPMPSERPLESPCLHPLLGELKLGYTPGCLNGLSNRLWYTLDKMTILAAEILPPSSWASSSDSVCHHFAVSTPQPLWDGNIIFAFLIMSWIFCCSTCVLRWKRLACCYQRVQHHLANTKHRPRCLDQGPGPNGDAL